MTGHEVRGLMGAPGMMGTIQAQTSSKLQQFESLNPFCIHCQRSQGFVRGDGRRDGMNQKGRQACMTPHTPCLGAPLVSDKGGGSIAD